MKDKVVWCDRGWQPLYYGFCPSEQAWNRECKRLKTKEPYPDTEGRATLFEATKTNDECVIVTINPKKQYNELEITGLLVHESVHVFQFVCEHIGETNPSIEFQAYSVQAIYQNLYDAYLRTKKI